MQEERGIPSGVSRNKLRGVLRFQKKTFNSRGLGGGTCPLDNFEKKYIKLCDFMVGLYLP